MKQACPEPGRKAPTSSWTLSSLGIILVPLSMSSGCIQGLDMIWQVEDLRVLAIQAEPPEVMYQPLVDPSTGFPSFMPSSDEVRFTALVVDPRGGELSFNWRFCPVESDNACNDFAQQVAGLSQIFAPETQAEELEQAQRILERLRGEKAPDQTVPFVFSETHGLLPYALPPFAVPAEPELFFHHLVTNGLGAGFGSWPSAVLEVAANGERLVAQKRYVISLAPEAVRQIPLWAEQFGFDAAAVAAFGLTFCPAGKTPSEVPGCLVLQDRGPNQNPVFDQVLISNGPNANADWVKFAEPVLLAPGQEVRFLPTFNAETPQDYQLLAADLDTRVIHVKNLREEIAVSWFATAGELNDDLTWPKFTLSLDTIYSAPDQIPSLNDGRVTLWLVARDQRGGLAWRSIEIHIVEENVAAEYWRHPGFLSLGIE